MRVAVVGAGLAGLVVALRRSEAGDSVHVFEAGARAGGQLKTERANGFVVELGAEGFIARSEAVPKIAADVGISARLAPQLVQRSYGFDGKTLVALAPGEAAQFLGFQVPSEELGRGIRTFTGGMQELSDALVRALDGRATLSLEREVKRMSHAEKRVELAFADGAHASFDAVVLATRAAQAARLLAASESPAAAALEHAKTSSNVNVTLAYPRAAIAHPLDGTGFVVALDQREAGLVACTFVSSKFAERAPDGYALLRLFFRPDAGARALDDAAWVARAEAALARILGVARAADASWVSRWFDALPLFDASHIENVRALEASLGPRRILLAGSAFHGSGIDAAVRSAEAAARTLSA